METVTVTASRASAFSLSEMEMLVGCAIVIAVVAWMALTHMRRDRHEPHT